MFSKNQVLTIRLITEQEIRLISGGDGFGGFDTPPGPGPGNPTPTVGGGTGTIPL